MPMNNNVGTLVQVAIFRVQKTRKFIGLNLGIPMTNFSSLLDDFSTYLYSNMYALNESNEQAGYTPVPASSIPAPVLGAEDPRYRCICGLMHALTGVLAVAIFEILFFAVFTMACFGGLLGKGVFGTGVFLIICLPAFVICGLMIFGVIAYLQ
uniref:Transmembrane protein n=1 Tax=Romanomermis culicivorax TaxID=13658 RepID=A0A915HPF8_ROMCU